MHPFAIIHVKFHPRLKKKNHGTAGVTEILDVLIFRTSFLIHILQSIDKLVYPALISFLLKNRGHLQSVEDYPQACDPRIIIIIYQQPLLWHLAIIKSSSLYISP